MPTRTKTTADETPVEPTDPPAPAVEPLPVAAAWVAVMRDVGAIDKASRNKSQGFNFRGIDAVMNTVGPVLRKHGVFVLPGRILEMREERYETSGGTAMHAITLTIEWAIYGPMGDSLLMQTVGEAADSGDKAASKAHSVAYRTAFLQALCIPTDEPDPDADSHQRAGRGTQGAATRHDEQGSRVTREAEQPAPDPRRKLWDDIIAQGQQARLTATEIRDDFQGRMGKAINGPDTTLADLTLYLQHMKQPPASADGTPAPEEQ